MKKLQAKTRPSNEISNLPSMSDIAFLLLIFFIVTTIFALEMGIPLVLPGKTAESVKMSRKNILVVQAHANGAITVEDELVPMADLKPLIIQQLARNDKLVIVIETHPDAEYGLMIDILDELKLAQARRISLKTMKGG